METRQLEKVLHTRTVKLAKVRNQTTFLNTCIASKKVPKGLSININPEIPGKNSNRFNKRWNAILNQASLSISSLVLSKTRQHSQDLHNSVHNLLQQIENETDASTFSYIAKTQKTLFYRENKRFSNTTSQKLENLGIPQNSQRTPEPVNSTKAPRGRKYDRKRYTKAASRPDQNSVINLSSHSLSEHEQSLLAKGLNFCPRPTSFDRGKLTEDTKAFSRRLRLKSHFTKPDPKFDNTKEPITDKQQPPCYDSDIDEPDRYHQFKPKSDWQPPLQSRTLETFIQNVESDISAFQPVKSHKQNLTKGEKSALHTLKQRDDIVIKPADKGSAVVVMDKDHYVAEAERQLNDTTFYKLLDHDPTPDFTEQVFTAVTEMFDKGYITEDNLKYLLVPNPKAGRFYLLPKIHKQGIPGRPIVSANGHPTERISEFIDFHLRPHVLALPSYLKDTTDYLRRLETKPTVPDNTVLVSLDVTSLYTNIPHEDGINACREAWDTRDIKDPPTDSLVNLLTIILKCNNFEFNGKHFLQIQGTAMGTKMAPSYANVFMGKLESQLLMSVPFQPLSWLRFIDDIDMQWCHGEIKLENFLKEANSFHPTIKFTSEVTTDNHVFLDTISHIAEDNTIKVDLYSKPTDTHQYLLTSSCHPKHCCKNIPYSLALRIRRICSDENTFEQRADELSKHLLNRGYNIDSVNKAIQRAKTQIRSDILQYKPKVKNTGNVLPFVLTYHPDLGNVKETITKHWPTIESSATLNKMFPEKPIIAYRRPKSLRDYLVRARLRQDAEGKVSGQSGPCNKPRCKTCVVMPTTDLFISKLGAKSSIKGQINCKTTNVVYLVSCTVCKLQYVGETKQQLANRMNLHRSDWKLRRFARAPLAEHFHADGHSISDMSLCGIETDPNWSDKERKSRETYWIRRLNTLSPCGINKGD